MIKLKAETAERHSHSNQNSCSSLHKIDASLIKPCCRVGGRLLHSCWKNVRSLDPGLHCARETSATCSLMVLALLQASSWTMEPGTSFVLTLNCSLPVPLFKLRPPIYFQSQIPAASLASSIVVYPSYSEDSGDSRVCVTAKLKNADTYHTLEDLMIGRTRISGLGCTILMSYMIAY